MVASAFPLADVLLRSEGDAAGTGRGDSPGTVSPDELPFPPPVTADGGMTPDAGAKGPDDASSVPGSTSSGLGSSSSGTGSPLLDQVVGAARLAGYELELPPLPVGELAAVNPLRPAILQWMTVTNAQVDPAELSRELARADALPQTLQRDLALVILSAAQATVLQHEATAALNPEQIRWIHEHPEVAADLARGLDTPNTRHLAFLAALVDTKKSLQAAALLLQAAEATRGSLASEAASAAVADLVSADLDPVTAQLLRLLADAGSRVSDAEKVRFAAEIISLTSGVPMPAAPAADVSFADAVAQLLEATRGEADADALAAANARAALLPADLERALALPVLAQARAVNAANPLHATPTSQTEALLNVLVTVADVLPTLEKYHLYWRTVPDALRISTWDSAARAGWALDHAALFASTNGDLADLVRAGGLLQGVELVDATVPQRSFVDAFAALASAIGTPANDVELDYAARVAEVLPAAARDASAIMMSGAAESGQLQERAYAKLSVEDREWLLTQTLDLTDILQTDAPTHAQLVHAARANALAEQVDRAALLRAAVVAARATADAADLLSGADAYGAQSARVTPVETGFWAMLSRLNPIGSARAQGPADCPSFDGIVPGPDDLPVGIDIRFFFTNDCEQDIWLRVHRRQVDEPGFLGIAGIFTDAAVMKDNRRFYSDNQQMMFREGSNDEILVVSGFGDTIHRPPMGQRFAMQFGSSTITSSPAALWGAAIVWIDLGGSDTYQRPVAMTFPGQEFPVSLHLDQSGSDFYVDPTTEYDALSPIYALMVDPDTGRKIGHPTQGAAVGGGVALLFDAFGDDRYEAPSWSQGFGHFGVGMLSDALGKETYVGQRFVQGAANEAWNIGLGILADADGDDAYTALTGQGYGIGGVLLDLGGQDIYFNDEPATGVRVVKADFVPGDDTTGLDARDNGRVWLHGPASLNPGLGVDVERSVSGRDSDGDTYSDFAEFLAGSDPNDGRNTPADGPSNRAQLVVADKDFDLYPDWLERALGTDAEDRTSYPLGVPIGPTFLVPVIGSQSPGGVLQVQGTPNGQDKMIDLRVPVQQGLEIERACLGEVRAFYNVSLPATFIQAGPVQRIPIDGNNGNEVYKDGNYGYPIRSRPNECVMFTYKSNGDGTGNSTKPTFSEPTEKEVKSTEFTYQFPLGILAVGDTVPTSYGIDYFVAIDMGGSDEFRNRAGGALPVMTERRPTDMAADDRDRAFLAPSLVINVDLSSLRALSVAVSNPDAADLGDDRYLPPVNSTGSYAQGSLFGVLVDNTGNDRYEAGDGSQGALGGVLLDLDGADTYIAGNLSQGASFALSRDTRVPDQPGYPENDEMPRTGSAVTSTGRQDLSLPGASLLLDLGTANDEYFAGALSQGFSRGIGTNKTPVTAVLLDQGGGDHYNTTVDPRTGAARSGSHSQAVAATGGLAVLADLAGNDRYVAHGPVSQASALSSTYGWHRQPQQPEPGAAALLDLGGRDTYAYGRGDASNRTLDRQNHMTLDRVESTWCCDPTNSGRSARYAGQPAIHLDTESSDARATISILAGADEGGIAQDVQNGFLVHIPTARLAIGADANTTYAKEYALVIDLGGNNTYAYNAGGFVPDVLVRAQGQEPDTALAGGNSRAVSLFPVSLLLDVGTGNNTYTAPDLLSQGAGFFSVGVLLDAGGNDTITALPEQLWTMQNDWKTLPIVLDGLVSDREWRDVEARTVDLVGRNDSRFDQPWTMRVANDERNLYVALEGPTTSDADQRLVDRVSIEMNPYRSLVDWVRQSGSAPGMTGIDQVVVNLGRSCLAEDRYFYRSGANGGFYDDRDINRDGLIQQTNTANEPALPFVDVDAACTFADGRWTIEIVKPFAPRVPADYGDMVYAYSDENGFLHDVDLAFRVSFAEGASRETFVFPAGATTTDGDIGFKRDNSLTDEMAAWAVTAMANLENRSALPVNTRVPALAQGAGLAGVGIVAMVGTVDSDAVYNTSERSQGFGAFGGIGLLLDAAGGDVYLGRDRVQGVGAAQGTGILIDSDGNDVYRSMTNANGFGAQNGVGLFFDLHGYDEYQSFGFIATSPPTCVTANSQWACEFAPEATQAKANEKAWRNGDFGLGADRLTRDDGRGAIFPALEEALFSKVQTRMKFLEAPADSDACDADAKEFKVDPVLQKPVLTGDACLFVTIDLRNGAQALAALLQTTVSVDSLDILVDGRVDTRLVDPYHTPAPGVTEWRLRIPTTELDDGVREVVAQAIFRVETEGRGAVLYADDAQDSPEGTSMRRVVINNAPRVDLDLEPKDALGRPVFSPRSSDGYDALTIEWSVSHDGGEDRIEAIEGYKPRPEGRNIYCSFQEALADLGGSLREQDKRLCHVLPFYFKNPTVGGAQRWDTQPGQGRTGSTPWMENSDVNTDLSQALAPLKTPLPILRGEDESGLVVQIPGRTAIIPGNFTTRFVIGLTTPTGDPLTDATGAEVVLVDASFLSEQVLDTGGLLDSLATYFDKARGPVQTTLDLASRQLQGNAISNQLKFGYAITCPKGDREEAVQCQNLYGNYGAGTVRACNPSSPLFAGTGAFLLQAIGACGPHSPVNASYLAGDIAGTFGSEYITAAGKAIEGVSRQLSAEPAPPNNWTVFHLPLDVDRLQQWDDTPWLDITDETVTLKPGYGFRLQMFTQHAGAAGNSTISLQRYYEDYVLGRAVNPTLDVTEDCKAPGATHQCGHVYRNETHVFTPPSDAPVPDRARRPIVIPTIDVNVTHQLRWLFNNNNNLNGADQLLSNPIPVSMFRYGTPEDLARLEVRTPAEPTTEAIVHIERMATGETFTVAHGVVEGDLDTTPTTVRWNNGTMLMEFSYDTKLRRITQRETPFDGAHDMNGTSLGQLPDGLYMVRVIAKDPYTNVPVERNMTFIFDRTEPDSKVTTPAYVGSAELADAQNNIPVRWAVTEEGAGVRQVHVFYTLADDVSKDMNQTTDPTACSKSGIGPWRPLAGSPYPAGTFEDSASLKKPDPKLTLKLLTVAEDRAGNLEHSGGRDLCAAVWSAVNLSAGVGYWEIRVDETNPLIGIPKVFGTESFTFQGARYQYAKGGEKVTFSVCAKDLGLAGLDSVFLALYYVDPHTGDVLNRTYEARTESGGDCDEGYKHWVSDQWGDENLDKALHPDGIWSAVFEIYDDATNRQRMPVGNLILDSDAPSIRIEAPIYPPGQSAVKLGDALKLRAYVEDVFGVNEDAISIDASALNATNSARRHPETVDGVRYQQFEMIVDNRSIENGEYAITIRVADKAGNVRTATFDVRVDFQRFEIVPGSLRVENLTHNTAIVRWETTQNTTSWVQFGQALPLTQRTATNETLRTEHEILVTGLKPSTRYNFRAGSMSAGGFIQNSEPVVADTLSALYLEPKAPLSGAAVSGLVDVAFEGGLLDSQDFVEFTLYVKQPRKGDEWTFVTTTTRQGNEHVIKWNSSRYLDGDGYMLRVEATAGADSRVADFGPFMSDNAAPTINVASPQPAVNTTRPQVIVRIQDALSGFTSENPVLRIDGRVVESVAVERKETSLSLTHTPPSALSSGAHTFEILVSDRAGNRLEHAWEVFVDSDAPVVRANDLAFVPGTSAARAGGQVVLNLTVQDASGVLEVLVDASSLKPGQTNVSLSRVSGTAYWTGVLSVAAPDERAVKQVRVTAFDRAGNVRAADVAVPVDNQVPVVTGAELANFTHDRAILRLAPASEPVIVRATATAKDAPQAAAATTEPQTAPELVFEGLLPSRNYAYELRAIDGAGNEALLTGTFSTLRDTTPPGAVTGLTVLDLLNGTLRLSWTAATDDVGVAFYRIYRSDDGASFQDIAEVRGLTYDDGQLPFEKSYTYQVVAVDHGTNEGEPSSRLTAAATAVPRLTAGTVSPTLGTTATVFRYTVTYLSPGDVAPTSIRVLIDGVPHEMTRDGEGGSFDTGVTYVYETRLAPHMRDAPHTYTFEATDGRYTVRFPDAGDAVRGPLVSGDSLSSSGGGFASFAQRVPLGGVAGLAIAVVAAALVAAVIIRKKKGGSN